MATSAAAANDGDGAARATAAAGECASEGGADDADDAEAEDEGEEEEADADGDDGDDGDGEWAPRQRPHANEVWLLVLYSPRCSMSRAVVPYVELAAATLRDEFPAVASGGGGPAGAADDGSAGASVAVRVGAFACGAHGGARDEAQRVGHATAFTDAACARWRLRETPAVHAVGRGFRLK